MTGFAEILIQSLISGVLLGGVYALMSIGFTLGYAIMRVSSGAQAAFTVLGAYVAYWFLYLLGIDPLVSIFICVGIFFVLGLFIRHTIMTHFKGYASFVGIFLATYAVAQIIENGSNLAWTGLIRGINTGYSGITINLGAYYFPLVRILCAAISFSAILILAFFLKYTTTGKAMRAVSQSRDSALLVGINVERIYDITIGLAAATAGAAGPLMGMIYSFSPSTQTEWVGLLYCIVVVGGMGSVFGTLASAVLFGMMSTVLGIFIPLIYVYLVDAVFFLVVLLIRPKTGLFGVRER